MSENPQEALNQLLTALSGHYKRSDGSAPANVQEVMALRAYKEAYATVTKSGVADATGAAVAALKRMAVVREDLTELPCWVIEPEDFEVLFQKGQRAGPKVDAEGNEIVGVRVLLPDGRDRFLTGIDGSQFQRLQPVKLKGQIGRTRNLLTGTDNLRISRESTLSAEGHGEPFPELTLEWALDTAGKGCFKINPMNQLIEGEVGDPEPFTFTGRWTGEAKTDFNDETIYKCIAADAEGREVQIKMNTEEASLFGAQPGDDGETVGNSIGGQRFFFRGKLSVFHPRRVDDLGGEGAWNDWVLEQEKLGNVYRNPKTKQPQLSLKDKPGQLAVDCGGTRIYGFREYDKKDGEHVIDINVLAGEHGGKPWASHHFRGGILMPIPEGGSAVGTVTVNKSDPLYQALSGLAPGQV